MYGPSPVLSKQEAGGISKVSSAVSPNSYRIFNQGANSGAEKGDDVVVENYLQLDLSLELLFCRVFSNKVSKAISVQLRNFDSNNIGEISEPQNVTNTNTNNLYLFRCETG